MIDSLNYTGKYWLGILEVKVRLDVIKKLTSLTLENAVLKRDVEGSDS